MCCTAQYAQGTQLLLNLADKPHLAQEEAGLAHHAQRVSHCIKQCLVACGDRVGSSVTLLTLQTPWQGPLHPPRSSTCCQKDELAILRGLLAA